MSNLLVAFTLLAAATAQPPCVEDEAARLANVEEFLRLSAFLPSTEDWLADLDAWRAALGATLAPDVCQNVDQTGSWCPRDYVLEYGLLGHYAFNQGSLQWLERTSQDEVFAADGTLTLTTCDKTRAPAYGVEAEVCDSTHKFTFESCGPRILVHDLVLPSTLSGAGYSGYTSPADICQLTAQACLGDLFPFDDDAACVAFFTAQPELCVSGPALQGSSAACRELHLWNAFNDPATHCPHVSPESTKCVDSDCPGQQYIPRDVFPEKQPVPKMNCFVIPSYFGSCDATSEAYNMNLCCEISGNFASLACADIPEVASMVASLYPTWEPPAAAACVETPCETDDDCPPGMVCPPAARRRGLLFGHSDDPDPTPAPRVCVYP